MTEDVIFERQKDKVICRRPDGEIFGIIPDRCNPPQESLLKVIEHDFTATDFESLNRPLPREEKPLLSLHNKVKDSHTSEEIDVNLPIGKDEYLDYLKEHPEVLKTIWGKDPPPVKFLEIPEWFKCTELCPPVSPLRPEKRESPSKESYWELGLRKNMPWWYMRENKVFGTAIKEFLSTVKENYSYTTAVLFREQPEYIEAVEWEFFSLMILFGERSIEVKGFHDRWKKIQRRLPHIYKGKGGYHYFLERLIIKSFFEEQGLIDLYKDYISLGIRWTLKEKGINPKYPWADAVKHANQLNQEDIDFLHSKDVRYLMCTFLESIMKVPEGVDFYNKWGYAPVPTEWLINPIMTDTATERFYYYSNYLRREADQGEVQRCTVPLNDYLRRLRMWQWTREKGLPPEKGKSWKETYKDLCYTYQDNYQEEYDPLTAKESTGDFFLPEFPCYKCPDYTARPRSRPDQITGNCKNRQVKDKTERDAKERYSTTDPCVKILNFFRSKRTKELTGIRLWREKPAKNDKDKRKPGNIFRPPKWVEGSYHETPEREDGNLAFSIMPEILGVPVKISTPRTETYVSLYSRKGEKPDDERACSWCPDGRFCKICGHLKVSLKRKTCLICGRHLKENKDASLQGVFTCSWECRGVYDSWLNLYKFEKLQLISRRSWFEEFYTGKRTTYIDWRWENKRNKKRLVKREGYTYRDPLVILGRGIERLSPVGVLKNREGKVVGEILPEIWHVRQLCQTCMGIYKSRIVPGISDSFFFSEREYFYNKLTKLYEVGYGYPYYKSALKDRLCWENTNYFVRIGPGDVLRITEQDIASNHLTKEFFQL